MPPHTTCPDRDVGPCGSRGAGAGAAAFCADGRGSARDRRRETLRGQNQHCRVTVAEGRERGLGELAEATRAEEFEAERESWASFKPTCFKTLGSSLLILWEGRFTRNLVWKEVTE